MAATKIRGNYTEENLKAAVKAVNENGLRYGDALKFFNMPTIHKYSKQSVVVKPIPGKAPVLTTYEEGALEKWKRHPTIESLLNKNTQCSNAAQK